MSVKTCILYYSFVEDKKDILMSLWFCLHEMEVNVVYLTHLL